MNDEQTIRNGILMDVGSLVTGLTAGMPERFFEVYNDLSARYPGLSFDTANLVAWEVVKYETVERERREPK